MPKHLKISRFTKSELELFREKCNFTEEELHFFNYRAKDESIVAISHKMNVSTRKADHLSACVRDKIKRVIFEI